MRLTVFFKRALVARAADDALTRRLGISKLGLDRYQPAILLGLGNGLELVCFAIKLKAEVVEGAFLHVGHIGL